MYYFYSKDYFGHEYCYRLFTDEELQHDMERTLDMLADPDFMPVETIYGDDFQGYETIEDFVENEVDGPEDMLWAQAVIAGQECYGYPFCIISHLDDKYEVCEEDKIDWQAFDEYAGPHAFKISPHYYKEGEITAEEADKLGAFKLAAAIREDNQKED